MKRKYLLWASLVAVAFIAAFATYNLSRSPGSQSFIRVAANLPLTGDLATYGKSVQDGAVMALDELGGSTPSVRVDWQDNQGAPATTVSILERQLPQLPQMYISGASIPQWRAINERVAQKGLPHFLWIFTPYINRNTTNNLRVWVSYKVEAPQYVAYAAKKKPSKVAILHLNIPHAIEEFDSIVIPELKKQGIQDIQVQRYDYDTTDFKDMAAKVAAFKPDLIILNGFQVHMVGQIRALRPLGVIKDGNTICTFDLLDAAPLMGPDEVEGLRVVAPSIVLHPKDEPYAGWQSRFAKRYGKEPLYTHAYAYDMMAIILNAAERGKGTQEAAAWLKLVRETQIKGVTGDLNFDDDGDIRAKVEIGVYRDGKPVPDM